MAKKHYKVRAVGLHNLQIWQGHPKDLVLRVSLDQSQTKGAHLIKGAAEQLWEKLCESSSNGEQWRLLCCQTQLFANGFANGDRIMSLDRIPDPDPQMDLQILCIKPPMELLQKLLQRPDFAEDPALHQKVRAIISVCSEMEEVFLEKTLKSSREYWLYETPLWGEIVQCFIDLIHQSVDLTVLQGYLTSLEESAHSHDALRAVYIQLTLKHQELRKEYMGLQEPPGELMERVGSWSAFRGGAHLAELIQDVVEQAGLPLADVESLVSFNELVKRVEASLFGREDIRADRSCLEEMRACSRVLLTLEASKLSMEESTDPKVAALEQVKHWLRNLGGGR